MHQRIHLSPVGCFTPARGKTMQKYCEVNGVKGDCPDDKKNIILPREKYSKQKICIMRSQTLFVDFFCKTLKK